MFNKKLFPLNAVIFLAAFLLFQIELIISKIILPKFGGSYLVWGAAVVFFQATLLLGYIWSHFVIQKFGISRYRYFHLLLLFLSLLFFPGRPLPDIHTQYQIPIVINISWQLLRSIGPVFFILSTTSIIFQSWLASSRLPERLNPYILYSVSNLGSFAALLSYPVLFEVFFDLDVQLRIWRAAYLFLLALHLIILKLISVGEKEAAAQPDLGEASGKDRLSWFLFGAAGAIMFLSVTNIITYEIAPIPLLWILPLCIYLISFVLNFKKYPWCPSWIREKFHITVGFSIVLFFFTQKRILPFMITLICYLVSLFIICMFCQNELIRQKPKRTGSLTIFYVIISTGSFFGGILVSWIIPFVSTSMIEYLAGLFLISLALIIGEKKKSVGGYGIRLVIYISLFMILWPMAFNYYNIFGIIIILLIFKFTYSEFKTMPRAFYLSLLLLLCLAPFMESIWTEHIYIYRHRNYYGIYKIYDKSGKRFLMHGTTLHGAQYLDEKKQAEPLTYYQRSTPVGELMTAESFKFPRIGIIGLGTGTLAAYANKGQSVDFFELDKDVFYIASKYFTYLNKSPGKINFIFGDARLSLKKAPEKHYDLLVIDAFSGDSVPVHLLTAEAISEYRRCLSQEGIILFHISNRYLDLAPVLFSNANAEGAYACIKSNRESEKTGASASVWVAFSWDAKNFQKLTSQLKWNSKVQVRRIRPWTDKYSNILFAIDLEDIFSPVKNFRPFYW